LLFIHGVWSVNLEEKISIKLFSSAFLLSVVMAEIAFVLSFWPTTIALNSLFLTSLVYVLLGLVQAQLSGRLFKRTVEEYLVVGVAVLIVLLFYSNWG